MLPEIKEIVIIIILPLQFFLNGYSRYELGDIPIQILHNLYSYNTALLLHEYIILLEYQMDWIKYMDTYSIFFAPVSTLVQVQEFQLNLSISRKEFFNKYLLTCQF